jgi:plastocyanin
MSDAMAQGPVRVAEVRTRSGFGWKRLAVAVAAVTAVCHVLIGAAYRDLDAIVVAVSFVLALGLMRLRRGTVGLGLLGLAFANVAFWTVPAMVTNLGGRFGFAAIAVPGLMAVLSVAGLVAAVGTLAAGRRGDAGGRAAPRMAVAAVVGLVIMVGLAAVRGDGAVLPEPLDLVLSSDSTAFSDSTLAAKAGTISVYLENRDYFWHTFTIHELGVDLRVPVGASGRVSFEAASGTYEYVCAIPGHDVAGMVGTLTVTGS